MTKMSYRGALRESLQADPRVFLMGEDLGRFGGSFAVTHGLLEEFGFLKNGQGLRIVAIEPLAGGSVLLIGDVATVMVDVASVELVFQVTARAQQDFREQP